MFIADSVYHDAASGNSISANSIKSQLIHAAMAYAALGWSVIPVYGCGRPNTPKAPAIKEWASYQDRLATDAELETWFLKQGHQGLAVVCGPVSHLAVLDLDSPDTAAAIYGHLPELMDTLTIRSGGRGLPHYYFHVPDDLSVPNKRIPGAELRYQGQYILAPPTCIPKRPPGAFAGQTVVGSGYYEIVHNVAPRSLSQSDLSCLLECLDLILHEICETRTKPAFKGSQGHSLPHPSASPNRASTSPPTISQTTQLDPLSHCLLSDTVVNFYRSQVKDLGRNQALFRTALLARDCHWSLASTQRILVEVHVNQSPVSDHIPETPEQRRREAERTIESAYSRPPQPRQVKPVIQSTGLPNAVRECLLNSGVPTAAAARLLDVLLSQVGWQPGHIFTEREACEAVKSYGVGRRSVRNALQAVLSDSLTVFEKSFPPNPPSKDANAANTKKPLLLSNNCFVGTEPKRVKNGRPSTCYALPHPASLSARLGVKPQASDLLQAGDFKTPTLYRQAQHREFIRRSPGQYSREWLGRRLGVSQKTVRRYDRAARVQSQPMFAARPLNWTQATTLPDRMQETIAHAFLESDGVKFPALRGIALGLLARGRQVVYKLRTPNFYCLADSMVAAVVPALTVSSEPPELAEYKRELLDQRGQRALSPTAAISTSQPLAVAPNPSLADAPPPGQAHALAQLVSPFGLPDGVVPIERSLKPQFGGWHPINHQHLNDLFRAAWDDLAGALPAEQSKPRQVKVIGTPLSEPLEESLAMLIYERLRALKPDKSLTRRQARHYVSHYGRESIQDVWHKLDGRTDIANPAGWFVAVLKADCRPRSPQVANL